MPVTPAIRELRTAGVDFDPYFYDYERYPGALGAAEFIGVEPHLAVKTIVMATDDGRGVIVLMHGDLEVSTKELARLLGVKATAPATSRQARRWTGYEFGGTSPLGLRAPMPVLAESSIADMDRVYVNAGKRGFVIGIAVTDLLAVVEPTLVAVSA